MEQRYSFTLLKLSGAVLLVGIAASLAVMVLPFDRQSQSDSAWQMAYFRAQLDFALGKSQKKDQVLGVRIYPHRWQFIELLPNDGYEAARAQSARFLGYHWQPWRPQSLTPSATLPRRLWLELQAPAQTGPQGCGDDEPDILILPGGDVTPFRLVFRSEPKSPPAWLQVDASGNVITSQTPSWQ